MVFNQSVKKRLQRLKYAQRLLALHQHAAKESGEFSYPPFVDLVEQWETLPCNLPLLDEKGEYPWGVCGHAGKRPRTAKIIRPLQNCYDSTLLRQAIAWLQRSDRSTDVLSLQQAILTLTQETRHLEARVHLVEIDDEETQATVDSALSMMRYARLYLMTKYSTPHFVVSQRLDAEQPGVDQAHRDRCFSYLTALNNAVHLLEAVLSGAEVRDGLSD